MTTTFWNANTGKSVPSGGSVQLTTAAGNGTNTGNWLSVATSNVKAGLKGSKLVIALAIIAVILYFIIRRKKHGK